MMESLITTGKKLRRFLKNGGGEVIGFASIIPGLIIIVVMVLSVIRNGIIRENLEYAAYAGARAAVVCTTLDKAEENARIAVKRALKNSSSLYKKIKKEKMIEIVTEDKEIQDQWTKGNYIRCTVTIDLGKRDLFLSKIRTASVVMMIERPAYDGLIDMES